MRSRSSSFLMLILGFTSMCASLSAQNYLYGTGNQPWGINLPIENGFINVANGQIHIEIPIASTPQRGGIPLNERLVYDSRIWQIIGTGTSYLFKPTNVPNTYTAIGSTYTFGQGTLPTTPNSMAGWRFIAGHETGWVWIVPNSDSEGYQAYFDYYDPSQTLHTFSFCTGGVDGSTSWGSPTGSGYATDGSGYYMTVTNYTNVTVYDPNGNEVFPKVIDRNGNAMTADSSGNLVDTVGRTPVKVSTSGNHIYYDVLTIGGVTKRYTVTTETINVHTAFNQSGTTEYSGSLTAIESLSLPDGSSYEFTYDSGTSGNYGELLSMTLPTGGTVNFDYSNYLDSYRNQNRWVTSYSGGHGSYTFAPQVVTYCSGSADVGCKEQVTVTDGNVNNVTYSLTLNNGAWNSQMVFHDLTDIMTTTTTYDFTTSCLWPGCNGAQWINATNTTATLNDTGQIAKTQYAYLYPWLSKPSSIKRWDYYTGTAPTTPTKETDFTYGKIVNGSYLPTQVNQLDSSGILTAQTTLSYDSPAATTAVGATNLLPAPGGTNRGNLTSTVSGIGGLVSTSSVFDTAGQKSSDQDGNGNTTTYSYTCSDAYIYTVSYGVVVGGSNLHSQTAYDCPSGLVTSTKDLNGTVTGQSTTYSYFTSGSNLGRIQKITYPDTGSTAYSYPSSTETDQAITQTTSASVLTEQIQDTYNRAYQKVTVAPEGSISSETTYDPAGNPSCLTNAHITGTQSATDGTSCTYYDILGRPWFIQKPDGATAYVTYTGSTKTEADELNHYKASTFDAFNRLIKVLEPNGSGTLSYETDYRYNSLDDLIQVDQWGAAQGATTPGDRKRTFAYDSLGRQIAENIPENQSVGSPASLTCPGTTTGTKWTSCTSYDGNGNVSSSTDNRGVTVSISSYDALNRPLRLNFSDGSGPVLYGYDTSSATFSNGTSSQPVTMSNTLGRISWSCRQNSAQNNCVSFDVFSYDAMGRIVQQWDSTPSYASSGVVYSVGAKYDLSGNRISLTYPDGRGISQSFDSANRFTNVSYAKWGSTNVGTQYFTANAFAPPGQVIGATYGNGVTVSSNFNNRQSLKSLVYTNSSGAIWSKQFTWDKNAANLLLTIDGVSGYGRQYAYDTLNRVTTARDVPVNNAGSAKATGTISITGSEQHVIKQPCIGPRSQCPPYTVYDSGYISVYINGTNVGDAGYGQGDTSATVATAVMNVINANTLSPATASLTVSGTGVALTSVIAGAGADYSLSTSVTYDGSDFSSASFAATTSGPTLTGGAGSLPANPLNESYSYDPFGNLTQAGSYTFSQSFNALNQINGYSYDAEGDQTTDIHNHTLVFDASGMLSSVAGSGETYTYNADGNRVQLANSTTVTDYIYFGGTPIAVFSGGAYTDFIYGGSSLIAEVAGTEAAVPVYRVADHLASLGGSVSNTGVFSSPVSFAPYGQAAGTNTDPFGFTGLLWDSTTGTNHAAFRQFSPQQGRWQSPDPDSGSYDLMNPQSLNRYAYVNGRSMAFTDPSGLDGGGAAGDVCAGAAAEGGVNVGADVACGALSLFAKTFLGYLESLFGPDFHGSLKPRPSTGPWQDKFGVPYGGLSGSLGQALGLPSGGCDFGACGPMASGLQPGGVTTAVEGQLSLTYNTYIFQLAALGIYSTYQKMIAANTIGADRYFHCLSMNEATSMGPGGYAAAVTMSWGREIGDTFKYQIRRLWGKGLTLSASLEDSAGDLRADYQGINGALNSVAGACNSLKVRGLP